MDTGGRSMKKKTDWKEESIKTRIETAQWTHKQPHFLHWKEESIKTRIETLSIMRRRT